MKEVRLETLIITKDAWIFLRQKQRQKYNCKQLTDEQIAKDFDRLRFRNHGANSKTHPIADNEVRITRDSFCFSLEDIKTLLDIMNFEVRNDGFVVNCLYV